MLAINLKPACSKTKWIQAADFSFPAKAAKIKRQPETRCPSSPSAI
jgi:hypothetical protein